ncbi:MAG: hypothetical protein IBJ19_19315, partial [Gemmatimonadaceae bacterium]|nr:hypothetical protein [Gemmatimonadaceae bacterium]
MLPPPPMCTPPAVRRALRSSPLHLLAAGLAFALLGVAPTLRAQGAASGSSATRDSTGATRAPLTLADIRLLAETHLALLAIDASADARSAQRPNKTGKQKRWDADDIQAMRDELDGLRREVCEEPGELSARIKAIDTVFWEYEQ